MNFEELDMQTQHMLSIGAAKAAEELECFDEPWFNYLCEDSWETAPAEVTESMSFETFQIIFGFAVDQGRGIERYYMERFEDGVRNAMDDMPQNSFFYRELSEALIELRKHTTRKKENP